MMGYPYTADFVFHHQESPLEIAARETKPYQNYHISVSIRKSAKCGHCTCGEQECCIMTDWKQ